MMNSNEEDTTHIGVARAPQPGEHHDNSDAGSDVDRSSVKKHSNMRKQMTAGTVLDEDDGDENEFFTGVPSDRGNGDGNEEEKESTTWGRGLLMDWKITVSSTWMQDMTNFNSKTIPVAFFMFFAAVAPAITFGAVYEKSTHHWIGAVEMLAATAWVGIVYALCGQPVVINGGTGPILAFSAVLYKLSETLEVPFLTFSAWVGMWVAAFSVVAAIVDLNRLILYATRFTDEIFSLLISLIFIINALGSPFSPVGLFYYFDEDHKSHDDHEDKPDYSYSATALLSVVLCFGTTGLAMLLKGIKFSRFFYSDWTRSTLSDFSVSIAIFVFIIVDQVAFTDIKTETLNVPDSFSPTYQCCASDCTTYWPDDCPEVEKAYGRRDWMVDLFDLNGKGWVPFFAIVPAFLAFILVFLDNGITLHLVNHPSHKLTHGDAYNLTTFVIGITIAINSLFGMPWLVAATVRSLNHLHALAEKDRDGKIMSVYETRLTNLLVHSMVLGSIFVLPALKLIPVPVLYGVFLYMGVASLGTNEFWGRFTMYFMQSDRYPENPHTKYVKARSMHMYTAIQMVLFCLLYFVKSIKSIAIGFPLVIAICIPVRLYLLPKWFTPEELILLDGEEDQIMEYVANAEKDQLESNIETPETGSVRGNVQATLKDDPTDNGVELATL